MIIACYRAATKWPQPVHMVSQPQQEEEIQNWKIHKYKKYTNAQMQNKKQP